MGASRTLIRKLDLDLIARIEASGRPEKPKKSTSRKEPRPHFTYRQNGRGRAGTVDPWAAPRHAFKDGRFMGRVDLNRSQNWPRAKSYAHAGHRHPATREGLLMLTQFSLPLWIDAGPIIDLAADTVSVLALFAVMAAILVGFDQLDRWIERRRSPLGRMRRRHFGGV